MGPAFERVEFAGGELTQVHDAQFIAHVQQTIARSLHAQCGGAQRGRAAVVVPPLPISPEARHAATIRSGPFLVSEKVDGIRYMIVLFTAFVHKRWHKLCVLSGRNANTYIVPLVIGERLFTHGCVFDGELVRDWDGAWTLLVFDTYMYEGTVMSKRSFIERASCFQRFVEESYRYTPSDPFRMVAKRFTSLRLVNQAFVQRMLDNDAHARTYPYPTDGIIVMHSMTGVQSGTCKTIFKFKVTHTVDLHFDATSSVLSSSVGLERPMRTPHLTVDPVPDWMRDGDIVECALAWDASVERMDITPLHVRRDKADANSTWVVERTMQTVKDALRIDELIAPVPPAAAAVAPHVEGDEVFDD
jgi:hypothetical protein